MDTSAHVIDTNVMSETLPTAESHGCNEVAGGVDIKQFINTNGMMVFWAAVLSVGILILIFILWTIGRVQFGKTVTSSYSSSFTPTTMIGGRSNYGNSPNWYMQDGCAGYNCSVDTGSSKSLGFGISNFNDTKSNFGPLPGTRQSNMVTTSEAQRRAAEEILRKNRMEANKHENLVPTREPMVHHRDNLTAEEAQIQAERAKAFLAAQADEVSNRQARTISGCDSAWDPMATEEAKVLGAVGVYKANTPGMSSFSKAINDNMPLTDAQLEAIMQGGEPFVGPAGFHDADQLAAQQRSNEQRTMAPLRRF